MSCCCVKILKFCTPISACDKYAFANLFKGLQDGTYTVELQYLDAIVSIPITVVSGNVDVTILNLTALNEIYTYTGLVRDSAGAVVKFTKASIEYDCFQFSTTIFKKPNKLV